MKMWLFGGGGHMDGGWGQVLLCVWSTIWGIHDPANRRIVQAHGLSDLGQTVAVFQMRTANRLIAVDPIGTGPGGEEVAQLRSARKPLLSWNLFHGPFVPESGHQTFDKPLAPEQHLPLNMLPE